MPDQIEERPTSRNPRTRSDRPVSAAAFAGVVLIVLGLALWALYWFGVGDERHSFAQGASAPVTVAIQVGKTYSIGIHGGVDSARARKVDLANLGCEITPVGNGTTRLAVEAERSDTKALDQVATFVSPVSGRVHVDCPGLPAVFVDNAVDAGTDWSGMCLLLASAALAVGLPLLLSASRRPRSPAA